MVCRVLARRLAAGVATVSDRSLLTHREYEVLVLISRGCSYREIAAELGIGLETVKSQVSAVLLKLGARRGWQAVAFAYQKGILA